jgi:hypothetical protein
VNHGCFGDEARADIAPAISGDKLFLGREKGIDRADLELPFPLKQEGRASAFVRAEIGTMSPVASERGHLRREAPGNIGLVGEP